MDSTDYPWHAYLSEACGLMLFMVSAGLCGTCLEAEVSPFPSMVSDPFLRRIAMGICMGVTVILIAHSRIGRISGAHLNPAVTAAYWFLNKISGHHALRDIASQFVGGIVGVAIAIWILRDHFLLPPVNAVSTLPGVYGTSVAFAAETFISAVLMGVVLTLSNSPATHRLTPYTAGVLVALFIAFEAPLSGMSMNPARSFASNVFTSAGSLWIYFVAPTLGMLCAAYVYSRVARRDTYCAKLCHDRTSFCIFRCEFHELVTGREPEGGRA